MPTTVRSTYESRPAGLKASRGLVTANHYLAAQAGAAMLEQGGNAVDAATAASFAVGVVEPGMSGLGGRAHVMIRTQDGRSALFSGDPGAPLQARPDMFDVIDDAAMPDAGWGPMARVRHEANTTGPLACVAPAGARTVTDIHRQYGLLPLAVVLEPAITLAAKGFAADRSLVRSIARTHAKLAASREAAAIFLPGGQVPQENDIFRQLDLARSLETIARQGPDTLYGGEIGEAIWRTVQGGGGILTRADLEGCQAKPMGAPLVGTFRDHTLLTWPGPAGGVTLLGILNLIELMLPRAGHDARTRLAAVVAACRMAYGDRWRLLDDPQFSDAPVDKLAGKTHARRRLAEAGHAAPPARGRPGDDTTHICAVDAEGFAVSLTQSLWHEFGSGVVIPGTGIVMNSAMHAFNAIPGQLGSIEAGKQGRHSGNPMIVLGPERQLRLVLGGAGGTRIISGEAQILLNVLDGGQGLQDAIAAPRIHAEGDGGEIAERLVDELGLDGAALDELALTPVEESFADPVFSRINGIEITRGDSGTLAQSGIDIWVDAGACAAV